MNELLLLGFIAVWFLFSLLEGVTEARLWHFKYKNFSKRLVDKVDSHAAFMVQRGIVLILLSFSAIWLDTTNTLTVFTLFFLANALTFSFIHNGMLYTHRNFLSEKETGRILYPKKWFDQSNTSSAVMTKFMTPTSRTVQFILGLVIYFIIFWSYVE